MDKNVLVSLNSEIGIELDIIMFVLIIIIKQLIFRNIFSTVIE